MDRNLCGSFWLTRVLGIVSFHRLFSPRGQQYPAEKKPGHKNDLKDKTRAHLKRPRVVAHDRVPRAPLPALPVLEWYIKLFLGAHFADNLA